MAITEQAIIFKKDQFSKPILKNKLLVSIYEKPSLRTRLAFERAMADLGGRFTDYNMQDIGIGRRESIKDIAEVVSRMSDVVCLRVYKHKDAEEFAKYANVPVINALSDFEHPCQALADVLTILECKAGGDVEKLKSVKVSYVGDCGNNVTHSLALACGIIGINFICAGPDGYQMNEKIYHLAQEKAVLCGSQIIQIKDPFKAVKGADVVYTDTWISMGAEYEHKKRLKVLAPYQVDARLMARANRDAIFMHDMPAYRGNEVTDDVIDGHQSIIYHQAENRLHAHKALLAYLLK